MPPTQTGRASKAGRHIGAEPRRQFRQPDGMSDAARQMVEKAQCRRRVARSATDPRRGRQALVESQRRAARRAASPVSRAASI